MKLSPRPPGAISPRTEEKSSMTCRNCLTNTTALIDRIDISVTTPDEYPLDGRIILQECPQCGFVQNQLFSDGQAYFDYYGQFYQKAVKLPSNADDITYFESVADHIVQLLSDKVKPRVLDFGSGNSPLQTILSDRGIDCETADIGVEPSNVQFDLIISTHVFEHLIAPQTTLRWLTNRLNSDGLLILTVPDLNRYLAYYQGPHNCFDLEHINHWNSGAFEYFVGSNGLDIISSELGLRVGNGIVYPELYLVARKQVTASIPSPVLLPSTVLSPLLARANRDFETIYSAWSSHAGASRCYFWGASTFLFRLFHLMQIRQSDLTGIRAIVDVTPTLHGLTLSSIPIISPAEFIGSLGSDEITIFICAVRANKILQSIEALHLPNTVRVVNLYSHDVARI